jgi:hypothetical protein
MSSGSRRSITWASISGSISFENPSEQAHCRWLESRLQPVCPPQTG